MMWCVVILVAMWFYSSSRACLISALWRAGPASLAMASHGLVAEGNACCLIDMFLVSQVWM